MFKQKKRTLKLSAETLRVLSGAQTRLANGGICSTRSLDYGNCTTNAQCQTNNPNTCVSCLTCQLPGCEPFTPDCISEFC